MSTAKFCRGDFVKLNNQLAVIVGIAGDENVPDDHVALWYGTTKENLPAVWTVPEEFLVEAEKPVYHH